LKKKLIQAAQEVTSKNGDKELVEGIFSSIHDNTIEIRAYLTPPDVRPLSTADVTRRWREQVGVIPGLEYIKFESDAGGPGRGAAMSVELSHQKMDLLERASADMAKALSFYPNTKAADRF